MTEEQSRAISVFYNNLECLLGRELRLTPIPMTTEAKTRLVEIRTHIEEALAPGGWLAEIGDFGSKLAEHICRIAGVLAAYEWQTGWPGDHNYPRQPVVDLRIIDAALAFGFYYADEQNRIRMEMAILTDEDEQLAERLMLWLRKHCESKDRSRFFLAEVYQYGPSRKLKKAADARRIIAILIAHGYLVPLQPGVEIDGKERDEAWELV